MPRTGPCLRPHASPGRGTHGIVDRFDAAILSGPMRAGHWSCIARMISRAVTLPHRPPPIWNTPMSDASIVPSAEAVAGLLRSGKAEAAEAAARQMHAANPQDCNAMVLLAISLSMLKRFPEAVEIHRRLIELQPNEAAHHNNLASSLWDMGALDEAEQAYRRGLSLNPNDPGALSDLGALRWQRGDAVETRELMLAAWQLDPGMPEPRVYGAPACHECADTEMTERLLEGSENWLFLGPKLEADLATILMQIDRTEEAEKRLRELLKRPDAESIARLRLASLM
ncbi:MAG: tetratricopeptide repeat protein, partial [Xanthomonadales bacterium]|nr:tetratricopeptide repeat protein [Xanthomonadales bacterium]